MAQYSQYSYGQHEPRTVEEVAAMLATGKRKLGITNEEFARTFQHFVDTNTLPLDMRYIVMLGVLVKEGIVKLPTGKREVWEALWQRESDEVAEDDDVTRDVTRMQDEEDSR